MNMMRTMAEMRPQECDDACGDTGDAGKNKPPGRQRLGAPGEGCPDRKHTIDQREGAIEQDKRDQCNARPGEREHAKDDRRNAAKKHQPPRFGHRVQQRPACQISGCGGIRRHPDLLFKIGS